ncbi:hypothetical protein EYF80_027652 [Liparis tanakae]|uniref:Uncharacterized protein n=1 Tax=Liparis tanakae TaxID=230148 RepID=A0A4Z2HBK3_9TELE|nr:hypothetical protein EYF80_027652 [Liparis tanakae]
MDGRIGPDRGASPSVDFAALQAWQLSSSLSRPPSPAAAALAVQLASRWKKGSELSEACRRSGGATGILTRCIFRESSSSGRTPPSGPVWEEDEGGEALMTEEEEEDEFEINGVPVGASHRGGVLVLAASASRGVGA